MSAVGATCCDSDENDRRIIMLYLKRLSPIINSEYRQAITTFAPMQETVTPYHSDSVKKEQVAEMFDNIAPKYDFLNQLLSLGVHKGWRKKSVKLLIPLAPKNVLDVATGTGDFAIEANKRLNPDKITGVDISEGMMKYGREKLKKLKLDHKIELLIG